MMFILMCLHEATCRLLGTYTGATVIRNLKNLQLHSSTIAVGLL